MIQLMVAQINRAYSSYRRRRVDHPAAKSSAKKGCMAATSAAISSGVHAATSDPDACPLRIGRPAGVIRPAS
jgi:hypothetical protein